MVKDFPSRGGMDMSATELSGSSLIREISCGQKKFTNQGQEKQSAQKSVMHDIAG